MDTEQEIPTICFEGYRTSTRCGRTVEFIATMLSRTMLQPVQDIIEEWEVELTHPRELHQKVIELKAALEEREALLRRKDIKLEEQKKRVEMLIRIAADSNREVEVLDDKNVDLMQRIYELEEDHERVSEHLETWMYPNRENSWLKEMED